MLTSSLAVGSLALVHVLPERPFISSVLVALLLGAVVINLPTGRWLRLRHEDAKANPFLPGLNYVGKTLLRMAVVLMGLRVEAHFFGAGQLVTIGLSLAAAIPSTFFLTHALAIPLRVPRQLADLVSAGTMICGASAVNAVSPVIGARREDQAIALGTVFLFSAVALVAFRSIASAVGLSAHDGGMWSGLAVNDLASSVAVGAQMGQGGAEMAAASKSLRILMLAPMLVAFGMARRPETQAGELRRTAAKHIPPFVAGFMLMVLVRAIADATFQDAPAWRAVLTADKFVVELAMAMVAASIGLNLRLEGLLGAGFRAVVLGAVAASTMAGLSLTLVVLGARGLYVQVLVVAASAVALTFAGLRVARHAEGAADRTRYARYRRERTLSGHIRLAPVTGEYRLP